MKEIILTIYLAGCGVVALAIVGLFGYLRWHTLRLERAPLFPIHEWMAFAASLDPPIRDEACAMIMARRFSWGWRQAFLDWHLQRRRLGLPTKYEDMPHTAIALENRPGVYVLAGFGYYKIGFSTDVKSRVSSMNTATPIDLVPVYAFWMDTPQALERELHEKFAQQRVRREWFHLRRSDLDELASMQARYATHSVNCFSDQR